MQQLSKNMQFRDMVILGLLFIGPAAPVGLFGVLDAVSDGAIASVYIVATLVMAFTAYSYARMANALPHAGAVYAYCSLGIHQNVGFLVGWLLLLDYMFIPAVAYLFSGISLNALIPEVPVWIWTCLALVLTTTLNLIGVKKSAKITLLILLLEIVVLLAVLFVGIWIIVTSDLSREWLKPFIGGSAFTWSHLFSAVSIAVLSYLGFDAIATFSEENSGQRNLVSKAIISCLILAGCLFVIQIYVVSLLSPYDAEYLRSHPKLQGKAYYNIVNQEINLWLGWSLSLMKAVGASFAAMVGQAAASRLLFSMGRDKRLPLFFAKISQKSGVPIMAILFAALFNLCLVIIAANSAKGLQILVSFVDIGALTAFIMLHTSVIGYFRFKKASKGGLSWILDVLIPIVGILVLLPVLLHIDNYAKIVGIVWLAVGLIILYFNKNKAQLIWFKKEKY
ncbi:APC family permease [Gilliamella sp. B2776]|uniref:APC family permease n=1 Tax=unclassified Gilliamella TaxID=2685620 RepID=UPI00226A31EE|nr:MULTISPECIES: APC family permease [unclassified Gilliamella]MCX8649039.1 APC family permease [Gilliamella sp. B2779]MCX8653085.1 APC family permease [Gilliamella sp. B2737]MCX8655344.1 APC family permease [Gilliamella sp. B2894]MCX8690851.1 APC family permease [Gilliamella sp. B2776]MCX8693876.1 APC family permease [Gilliamella sp. B2881]